MAVVIAIAVPSEGNIKKKKYEKLEKYQGLKEELERTWKVKAKVVPVMMRALRAVASAPRDIYWKEIRPAV